MYDFIFSSTEEKIDNNRHAERDLGRELFYFS